MRNDSQTHKAIQFVIAFLFGLMLILNLIVCVLAEKVDSAYPIGTGLHNLFCLGVGAFIAIIISLVFFLRIIYIEKKKKKDSFKRELVIEIATSIVLFLVLIVSTHFYYFKVGWDAGTVINQAIVLADGRTTDLYNEYYSIYPNNIALTVLLSLIIRIGRLLPIGTDYYVLVAFQCFCMAVSSVLIYYTSIALSLPKSVANISRCFFIILACLSPWAVVPYSDTIGMFVIVLIIYFISKDKFYPLVGFLLVLGSMIKPTVCIIAIAAFLVFVGYLIKNSSKEIIKPLMKKIGLIAIGAIISYVFCKIINSNVGFVLDSEKAMSPAHYLMMGLNEQHKGIINLEDQSFSFSIPNYNDRIKANLEVTWSRLVELGPLRLVHHYLRKLYYSFGDGTFAWAEDGGFFQEMIWTGNEKAETIFRSIYYPEGSRFGVYRFVEQAIWLGIMVYGAIGSFMIPWNKENSKISTFRLTVIGMVMFELLFEPRARHLLLAVPLMCILGAYGCVLVIDRLISRNKISTCVQEVNNFAVEKK